MPRINKNSPNWCAGQIEELLTNYGRIDLIWFDGKPNVPNADQIISIERIRELQPQIVINPRLHGHGDFVTYERKLTTDKVATGWAEFCNTWTGSWSHQEIPFRSDAYQLGPIRQMSLAGHQLFARRRPNQRRRLRRRHL